MKRSPLKRRTPLTRKSPMKRMSAKKRKEHRETDEPRRAFKLAVGCCMNCGETFDDLDVHEIANGPARSKAVRLPRLQMVLCRECHDLMGDKAAFPVARQLAKRLEWEIVESIEELAAARGDRLVRMEDVLRWLK